MNCDLWLVKYIHGVSINGVMGVFPVLQPLPKPPFLRKENSTEAGANTAFSKAWRLISGEGVYASWSLKLFEPLLQIR